MLCLLPCCFENISGERLLHANPIHKCVFVCVDILCVHPTAVATESGLAEPRSASAAVRPLHRACDHVSPGDCGLCEAASWFPGAHEGGPDCSAKDINHRGFS